MAVPRVEWECPVCHRHFAIRTDMPSPTACPQCSAQGGGAAQPTVIAGSTVRQSNDAAATGLDVEPSLNPDTALEPGSAVYQDLPGKSRRYRALHVMALGFKAFAAMAVAAAIAALTLMALAAFRMQNPETRSAAILRHLAEFAGCALATLVLWCAAELIALLIDIEANTRRRPN